MSKEQRRYEMPMTVVRVDATTAWLWSNQWDRPIVPVPISELPDGAAKVGTRLSVLLSSYDAFISMPEAFLQAVQKGIKDGAQ